MDLGTFFVQQVIVHEVPARFVSRDSAPVVLSDVPSPLDDDLRRYFREKIIHSLDTRPYAVEHDATTASPVPGLVHAFVHGDGGNFVSVSQQLAQHLYNVQRGYNSPGLLTAIDGVIDGGRCIAVLKLEKEQGVRVRQQQLGGKQTFGIEFLRELMLTEGTRVFKAGLFPRLGTRIEDLAGLVSDNQRGYTPRIEVADFFLSTYLGFKLRDAPDIATKRFFEATESFINEQVDKAETKARYQMALSVELNSSEATVRPRRFAETHFDPSDRDPFLQTLRDSNAPTGAFDKQTDLIATRIRQMTLDFEEGVSVVGRPTAFEQNVKVTEGQDGRASVTIEGKLSRVAGK